MNLHRRHLNEPQRGVVGARIATRGRGARPDLSTIVLKSQAEVAELLNVSVGTVTGDTCVCAHLRG